MELAKRKVLAVASASLCVVSAATEYATRRGFRNVSSYHFRLEKEMQSISVAAEGMVGVLTKSSLPDGPPLDDRLQEWFSTDELAECLDTLNQMEKILQNDTWMNTIFNFMNTLRSSPQEDKINAAVKLFDSRRDYFHFLLTTDVWNCEEPQQPRARSPHAQDGPAVELVLESNIAAKEIDEGQNNIPNAVASRPTPKKMNDLWRLDDIFRWLDGLSCTTKQEETLSLRQPDTCTWLNSTPEYISWRDGDRPSLWLRGKPGSGKTILASFVIDSLKNKRGETLAFFYCDFRNDRSTSAAEVVRSLLSQLLRHLRSGNADPGGLVDDLIGEKDGDTPILTNVKYLATFVSRTAKQLSQQPLVIVDALDECRDVEKLLDGLFVLIKCGMRLFVTSRPLQIIKDGLRGVPSISMDKMVDGDIALHVTRELDSRRRLRDLELGIKMEIHSILCDKADGMFRWVQCQIDTLNQCATKAEVREALNNLPIGLDETYQRILVAIDTGSPEGKLALRALVWLVGALRPLRLLEILDGLSLDLGRWIMDRDTGPMHKGALLGACGSLVTYNEDTGILILSHFSVKEYLTGDPTRIKLPRYHISFLDAHEHLVRVCICYVTLYLKHVEASDEKASLHRIMCMIDGRSHNATAQWSHISENPLAPLSMSQELLDYVFAIGFNHLAYLGSANRVVLKDMEALQSNIKRHPSAWETIRRMSQRHDLPVPWPDFRHDFMLYILISFASDSLLHVFLGHNRKALKPKYKTNPLLYAAHFGKAQHAELLLSRGAKVNERGLVVDASRQALPLEVAVSRQHDAMVDLLLSTGSIVPNRLFALSMNNNYPIRIARRLLQTDEFMEWATEPGKRLPSPIGLLERRPPLVYERDIIIMIRKLVQAGLDPAACNSAQKTALHLAIVGGYHAVVVFLLLISAPLPTDFMSAVSRITSSERISILRFIVDIGADISVIEDTALHMAVKTFEQDECLEAVSILVGAGYDSFGFNDCGKTLLHIALDRGFSLLADYLLSTGKSLPPDTLFSILHSALPEVWRARAVCSLIDKGADTRRLSAEGSSLLHAAMFSLDEIQGLGVARLLVGVGCDPFGTNKFGQTPFHIALDRKFPLLVDYLLSTGKPLPPDALFSILRSALPAVWRARTVCSLIDKGADTRRLSAEGNTLLHAAMFSLDEIQGLGVARLLVGVGCDPFGANKSGQTPFHIALNRKFPLLVDYLLSTGKALPPSALFSILRSALPAVWRARTVCSLIDEGADTRGLSAGGITLLHTTVLSLDELQGLGVAKLLVGGGCDPFGTNNRGKTPLHIALDRKFPLLTDYLLTTGKSLPPDALFAILRSAFPAIWRAQTVCSLVDKGADTRGLSAAGDTLLHTTVLSLDDFQGLGVVKHLVNVGCDPFGTNQSGKTPLHIALKQGYSSIADYLLSTKKLSPSDSLFAVLTSKCSMGWIVEKFYSFTNAGADIHSITANGNNLIHAMIMHHSEDVCLELLTLLINHGCNTSACNGRGETALHIAAEKGFISVMNYILSLGQSPPDDILLAVLKSRSRMKVHMLRILMKKGANTHVMVDGNTLLHIAISPVRDYHWVHKHVNSDLRLVVETLVDGGCNVLAPNSRGKTPLHLAVAAGYVSVVKCLLMVTTQANLPADILACALDKKIALTNWEDTRAMLQLLIGKGADIHVRAGDGGSLLHMVIKIPRWSPLSSSPWHPSPILPWHPSPLSQANTRLSMGAALRFGDDDLYLSQPPKDISQPHHSESILRPAVSEDDEDTREPPYPPYNYPRDDTRLEIIRILVDSGCDPSQRDIRGRLPVHVAVLKGYVGVVEYLLPRTIPPPRDLGDATKPAPSGVQDELRKVLTRWESRV